MVDPKLREAAEREMGRLAPESREDGGGKRRKTGKAGPKGEEEEGGEAAANGPRSHQYEYQAAGPLLRGASGFLISCSFKRERSAIGEMAAVLQNYISAAMPASVAPEGAESAAGGGAEEGAEGSWRLRPVKLAARGVVFLWLHKADDRGATFPGVPSAAVAKLVGDIAGGRHPHLRFCHRVMPIERSCPFDLASLQATASECAERHLKSRGGSEPPTDGSPGQLPGVTYAVRFNIRGSDKAAKAQADGGGAEPRLDRAVVTKALAEAFAASCDGLLAPAVDLSTPQVVVFGESVGLASGEHLAMLCVVDSALVTLKPRMCMRSIFAGGNA
mmetsp:Transcript_25014/g.64933  ORF Transcript_25014/g.64933 Transcript_25014/m.64933 type:complete len:331 (-) Transcript_25014:32-1024(-)